MNTLFGQIFVFGTAAVMVMLPTVLVVFWALCRTPSWNAAPVETPRMVEAANDTTTVVAEAA